MATRKSKPFAPKEETAPVSGVAEAESLEEKVVLTVDGVPIPPEFAHAIPYAMTDQGIAEREANGKPRAMVSVVKDEWDQKLDRKAEAQPWDSFDPLSEAVDGVREPGMAYRFISDRVVNRRGRRGWEIAEDKKGQKIVVAGQTLGKMPIERAAKRNKHYQDAGNDALANAAEQYQLDQAKVIRDAKVRGMAPLRAGERVTDNHSHPGMSIETGIHATRGEGADAA